MNKTECDGKILVINADLVNELLSDRRNKRRKDSPYYL